MNAHYPFLFQNKTFTVSSNGKTAGLTLDWNLGFSLHEGDSKMPVWQYKFSQLRGSSDDGKSKLKLHFQDIESKAIETKVHVLVDIMMIVYNIDFLVIKMVDHYPPATTECDWFFLVLL